MTQGVRWRTRLQTLSRTDGALALAAAVSALALYLRTLHPGLVGTGDSPKFQFVGLVLGTAHNPGYPLYVVLSRLFSCLPLGSPAYRMNLLAALCGALAVAFVTLAARRLGARRVVAAATAWSFGMGPVFWSQCTLAEVYALAAALLAATIWTLLVWDETGRPAWLRAAVILTAISLGHHLTVVTIAPALLLFVVLRRWREALRPRFLAFACIAVLLGLAQYGFILLRTYQGAPYLGSSAHNVAELVDVLRGHQFGHRMFAFDGNNLLHERAPLIAGLVADELGATGVLVALVGAIVLARRRPVTLLLLGSGAVGVTVFALNYGVPDIAVFLIPAFVLAWLLAASGIETVVALATRRLPRGLAVALPVLVFVLPTFQLVRSFRANDHSDRTFEIRYFNALFAALPQRVAFVNETHSIDHMILYKIYAERGEQGRAIYPIPARGLDVERRLRQGVTVYAFEAGRRALKPEGFAFEPVRLLDRPLTEYLHTQPEGALVVVTLAGEEGARAAPWLWPALGLGAKPEEPAPCIAVFPMRRPEDGRSICGGTELAMTVRAGESFGRTRAPLDLRISGGRDSASIALGHEPLIAATAGAVVAVIDADGSVFDRQVVRAADQWRAAFPERALRLWRVRPHTSDPAPASP